MKVLLFGNTGQLGSFLEEQLSTLGQVIGLDLPDVDLCDLSRIKQIIGAYLPDAIINAAAYTAVDQAETDRETAMLVNAGAPGAMAEAAKLVGALFLHYSTDYVFSGESKRPYTEEMPTGPCNVYGETKLAGERAVESAGGDYVILRTSWLYSHRGRNFFNTMVRLADERNELRVVDDQFGAPTYAGSLAKATATLLGQWGAGIKSTDRGIYHATCAGVTSWHAFAEAILQRTGRHSVSVLPVPTSAYPTPARRPSYSVLDNGKLRRHFNISLPDWQHGLDACISDAGRGIER